MYNGTNTDGTYAASFNFNYRNPASPGSPRIVIIGTAHVSEKSVAEVSEAIDREKPDIVAVELCKGRYQALKGEEEVKEINVREMLSGGKFYYFLLHWLLSYVQRKIGSDTGVKPGAEMLAAIEKAEKTGAKVALIDRDIQVTLSRFWNKMSLFEKLKLFASLLGASLGFGTKDIDMDEVTNEDVVTQLISELRKMAPSAASVLLDERNAIMAKNLLELSKEGSVVAVVGAGHREGIQEYLKAPQTIPQVEELMTVPKKRFGLFKVLTVAFIAMIVGLLALLIFSGTIPLETLAIALLYLFVTQGILSAIGVIVARGHPLSALTAFSLAWFAFLNPFLAVGWLAGIVEAHFRPPTNEEVKNIMKDEYLFTWDRFPEGSDKLIGYIEKDRGAKWIKTAKIEKTDDATINISSEKGNISLRLNDKKDRVNVVSGDANLYEFTVEKEMGKLNVYRPKTLTDLMQNKLFRIILVAGLANLGSMLGTFVAIPFMVHYLHIPDPLAILKTALGAGLDAVKHML